MIKSITYFEENCIKKFEKMENDFLRNPLNMAEYVYGITEELHKLGLEMAREALEMMDQMLVQSPVRKKNWIVEAHDCKSLITSLGDVTFQKTLFQNKQTKEYTYLLDRILGLAPKQRLTEDTGAAEKNRHGELRKYMESISHSLSTQNKKIIYFATHIRGL